MAKKTNKGSSKGSSSPKGRKRPQRPYWDADLRELWFGSVLVKAFTGPAPNQELILTAFQESGWKRLLLDPLPPTPGIDSRERFQDAVERLNLYQRTRFLRFRLCRKSTAVVWQEYVPAAALGRTREGERRI
jgi:hypothetical protein